MIKVEVYPSRPTGGQQVGTGPNCIRAVHYIGDYPSVIEAVCERERSQHKNKRIAVEMIEWACASLGVEL